MPAPKGRWLIVSIVVLAVGCAAGVTWRFWPGPKPPDPATASPTDIAKYMATSQFAELPMEKRQEYFDRVNQAQTQPFNFFRGEGLSRDERDNLRENVAPMMEAARDKQMKEYFALAPEDREAYLDKIIDQMLERQQARATRPSRSDTQPGASGPGGPGGPGGAVGGGPGGPPGGGRGGGAFNAQRMRDRIEGTNPLNRAQRIEFRQQLQQQMQKRGIAPRGG